MARVRATIPLGLTALIGVAFFFPPKLPTPLYLLFF